jgi:hypothetical protein
MDRHAGRSCGKPPVRPRVEAHLAHRRAPRRLLCRPPTSVCSAVIAGKSRAGTRLPLQVGGQPGCVAVAACRRYRSVTETLLGEHQALADREAVGGGGLIPDDGCVPLQRSIPAIRCRRAGGNRLRCRVSWERQGDRCDLCPCSRQPKRYPEFL